jgi:hypothetical protein
MNALQHNRRKNIPDWLQGDTITINIGNFDTMQFAK